MTFRDMSEEMTNSEIVQIFRIIFPYGKIKRHIHEIGYITVYYSLPGDGKEMERRIDFLPDDIYLVEPDSKLSDGEPLRNCDALYRFRQFMIAKGYSEYWLDNPYLQYEK